MKNNNLNKTFLASWSPRLLGRLAVLVVAVVLGFLVLRFLLPNLSKQAEVKVAEEGTTANADEQVVYWQAPNLDTISDAASKNQITYGRELIAHTAKYLGPEGTVRKMSNGMNCQNCHLQAGTGVFANNYGSVASTYPRFRARSGAIEDIYKRVNDCLQRSLNGQPLDTLSVEMQALKAYFVFLGTNVKKGESALGAGLKDIAFLDRAADPEKGKLVYVQKCQSCHQANGEGIKAESEYIYPPLWGKNSYNDAAGLYRISNFAKYVKYNMPLGITYENPILTDEEAWDVAAYVNSQVRPHKNTPKDWPDISKKPIDHPFGPYADSFSEEQHKYGPFQPIAEARKK
jgi:thiosulfate dehydrogenase